ncbi:hypothetical protein B0H63DRAFT_446200 [Podospora didyma]|uniref:Uncharacterized protein n=1 Tax=Podospora didyma TaxID=330526 RepID=A0AAE0NYH1_9PEZI|nr:hypothetical protein B0H63DRAFT_446200 [Podospora didyma]
MSAIMESDGTTEAKGLLVSTSNNVDGVIITLPPTPPPESWIEQALLAHKKKNVKWSNDTTGGKDDYAALLGGLITVPEAVNTGIYVFVFCVAAHAFVAITGANLNGNGKFFSVLRFVIQDIPIAVVCVHQHTLLRTIQCDFLEASLAPVYERRKQQQIKALKKTARGICGKLDKNLSNMSSYDTPQEKEEHMEIMSKLVRRLEDMPKLDDSILNNSGLVAVLQRIISPMRSIPPEAEKVLQIKPRCKALLKKWDKLNAPSRPLAFTKLRVLREATRQPMGREEETRRGMEKFKQWLAEEEEKDAEKKAKLAAAEKATPQNPTSKPETGILKTSTSATALGPNTNSKPSSTITGIIRVKEAKKRSLGLVNSWLSDVSPHLEHGTPSEVEASRLHFKATETSALEGEDPIARHQFAKRFHDGYKLICKPVSARLPPLRPPPPRPPQSGLLALTASAKSQLRRLCRIDLSSFEAAAKSQEAASLFEHELEVTKKKAAQPGGIKHADNTVQLSVILQVWGIYHGLELQLGYIDKNARAFLVPPTSRNVMLGFHKLPPWLHEMKGIGETVWIGVNTGIGDSQPMGPSEGYPQYDEVGPLASQRDIELVAKLPRASGLKQAMEEAESPGAPSATASAASPTAAATIGLGASTGPEASSNSAGVEEVPVSGPVSGGKEAQKDVSVLTV